MRDHFKDDPDFAAQNATAFAVTGDELRQLVERIEHFEAEKKDAAEQQKEVYAEAKGRGFSVPTIKQIVTRRKKDRETLAEQDELLNLYQEVLGG